MQRKLALHISDLDCGACAIFIDGDLESIPGVFKAQTNYAASRTDVLYDPQKITPKKMITVIKKIGFAANVLAN